MLFMQKKKENGAKCMKKYGFKFESYSKFCIKTQFSKLIFPSFYNSMNFLTKIYIDNFNSGKNCVKIAQTS